MRESLRSLIERAYQWMRSLLDSEEPAVSKYRLKWVIVEGGARAGVDLADRGALTDLMNRWTDDPKIGER